jgi:hypothetical protein
MVSKKTHFSAMNAITHTLKSSIYRGLSLDARSFSHKKKMAALMKQLKSKSILK